MVIGAQKVTKKFKCRHGVVSALEDVSLEIRDGEFVSITGPSGSGKSTLLMALGGMSRPDDGVVLWDNQSIYGWDNAQRARWRGSEVGFIFQVFNLVPYLTVYENVSVGLSLAARYSQGSETIDEILEELDLSGRRNHTPDELSVGQHQRVALARALVKKPRIILADEPTGNLDAEAGSAVIAVLKKYHAAGSTLIIITHDRNIANQAQRIISIADGKMAA